MRTSSPEPSTATRPNSRRSGVVRRALPLTLLLVLACVPSAHATSRMVIRGAGFGHGIGMSQYGAYGLALQGVNYTSILSRYYTGTQLSQLSSEPEARVLLQSSQRKYTLSGAARIGTRSLDPAKTYNVIRGGSGLVIREGSKALFTSAPPLRVDAAGGGAVLLNGGSVPGVRGGRDLGAGRPRRPLPRRRRVPALRPRHHRDQRRRARGLRARRRVGREPVGVAGRDAEGAGGRGAHLRDHLAGGIDQRRLRPVRRHALADVQGRRGR